MQTYTIMNLIWGYIALIIMGITLLHILIYFVKEIITNNRKTSYQDSQSRLKEVKRKIKKEQKKIEKYLGGKLKNGNNNKQEQNSRSQNKNRK